MTVEETLGQIGTPHAPDFFCVGAEKCGTTWLWQQLSDHPHIGVPYPKELRYFAARHIGTGQENLRALRQLLLGRTRKIEREGYAERLANEVRLLLNNDDAYLRIFGSMAEPVVGEVSPQYCVLPAAGIAHMRELAPKAKIVFLVRDPTGRAISGGKMRAAAVHGTLTQVNLAKMAMHPFQLRLSRYSVQIEAFEAAFPGRVFVGLLDDIVAEPTKLLAALCDFLGVAYDPAFFPAMRTPSNTGEEFRPARATTMAVYMALSDEYAWLERRFGDRVAGWRRQWTST